MLKGKVWTPSGYLAGPVNSLVGKGESIINYEDGTGTLVTKGKRGVDNQPSSVQLDDDNVIAGNDIDWTNGMKFSDQVAPLTAKLEMYNNIEKGMKSNKLSSLSKQTMELQNSQLQRAKAPILNAMKKITDRQQMQHEVQGLAASMPAYDEGKGEISNSLLDFGYAIPAALEGQMLSRWMKESPVMPNVYAANRYAPQALSTLNRMRVDPYTQILAANLKERAAYYGIQLGGNYTGGLRLNARVALALGNARNMADIYNQTQIQNNKYRTDWVTSALAEGNQDAARRQAASQYAWDAYNKAYGAKTKGIETHLANLGLLGQKWLAQRIKNKQYSDTLSLYQQDVKNRQLALAGLFNNK